MSTKERDFSIDNIRCFLIVCVVFGHLVNAGAAFEGSLFWYKVIYTFHMPAFLFLSGYNTKYSASGILYHWMIPYVVFQTLYILYESIILNGGSIVLQYTTPCHVLWYMMACIFYQLLIPIYDTMNTNSGKITFFVISFILSILIGFDQEAGAYFSISRFFVFQPWFLMGYYCKKTGMISYLSQKKAVRIVVLIISVTTILVLTPICIRMTNRFLYGENDYMLTGGEPWMRFILHIVAFSWISLLFIGIKPYVNKIIPLITKIGQNTLPIYLLHSFPEKYIDTYCQEMLDSPGKVILITIIILLIFGNSRANKIVNFLRFSWLANKKIYLTKKIN